MSKTVTFDNVETATTPARRITENDDEPLSAKKFSAPKETEEVIEAVSATLRNLSHGSRRPLGSTKALV